MRIEWALQADQKSPCVPRVVIEVVKPLNPSPQSDPGAAGFRVSPLLLGVEPEGVVNSERRVSLRGIRRVQ